MVLNFALAHKLYVRAEIFAGENYFGPNSALVAIDERIGAEELSLTADFRQN